MHFLFPAGILQIVLRCIAVYFFVLVALRIFGKKELAQLSVVDLVFILLISNAVQNAMVGNDTSLEGGLVAALSLFVINFLLKKFLYQHQSVSELLQGKTVLLIYKGVVQLKNLTEAGITAEELQAAIREHGVADAAHVDLAMLEVDGNISVISANFTSKSIHAHKRKHRLKGKVK